MHILAILGALVGVLLFALFRMQQAANAARDIVDAADEARGVLRRWSWRRKHITNPLDTVDDAREAAAAMMVVVAQSDGGITERERSAITREMIKRSAPRRIRPRRCLLAPAGSSRTAPTPGRCSAA